MRIFIILLILFTSIIGHANEWTPITPLPYCPEFIIEYKLEERYYIRYKKTPHSKYQLFPTALEDINNLSLLTDELTALAKNYCPGTYILSLGDEQMICYEKPPEDPFGSDYSDLLKSIITSVNKGKTSCDDVIPLIELQNEISSLRSEELLDFDKSGNIMRLLVGEESDELIDHFMACGGKKGTKQFIQNLVMIESKKACLFPAPPGLLSFEKTKKIAEELANEYPDMSLLKLNSRKDNIVRKAIIKFVDEIFTDQIKSLLGQDYDAKPIISKLESIKSLKAESPKQIFDHIQYLTALNAPLEIVDVGLPIIIKENFKDILPKTMSQQQKDDFLNDLLIPAVTSEYDKCIEPIKSRIEYNSPMTTKDAIKQRKGLEKQFCQKNSEECIDPDCESIKNLLTKRKDITDMQMIQACVFKSFTTALYPTLHEIVKGQKENLGKYIDFTPEIIENVSLSAYDTLMTCADQKIKEKTGQNYKETFDINIEALYHLDSGAFIDIVNQCSTLTEQKQVKDFISIIINSMDVVRDIYGNGKEKDIFGIKIDQGAYNFSQQLIDKTIPTCLEVQNFRVKKFNKNSASIMNCTPLIEMEAGQTILIETINDSLREYNLVDPENKITKEFESCSTQAKGSFKSSLLNPEHKNPILDADAAENYLSNNDEYYNCVKKAVLNLTDMATENVLDKSLKEMAGEIQDSKYFSSIMPEVKKRIHQCFADSLNKTGSWPNFLKFNEDHGLEKLQKECTEVAVEYALPLVIAHETDLQINDIMSVKLIDQKEKNSIKKDLTNQLQLKMNIVIPKDFNEDRELYVLKEAYKQYRQMHPKSNDILADFVNDYSKLAEPVIVGNIGKLIISDVASNGFDDLSQSLPPKCIASFYSQNKVEIEKLIKKFDDAPASDDDEEINLRKLFVDLINSGLGRAKKQKRYDEVLKNLSSICKNPANYKDLNKLIATGIGDDLIISQIEESLQESFSEIAIKQCFDSLKETGLNLRFTQGFQDQICHKKLNSSNDVERLKKQLPAFLSAPKDIAMLDLILYRRYETERAIREKLKDPNVIDKAFYQNRDLLTYIYSNFQNVITDDPATSDKLNVIAVESLFKDKSKGSFAANFVESQLIYSIGESGFDQASKEVEKSVDGITFWNSPKKYALKKSIKAAATNAFHEQWNYQHLKENLAFSKTDSGKTEQIIQSVYDNAIRSEIDPKVKGNMLRLNNEITQHLEKNRVIPNPNYNAKKPISEDNQKYFNFNEKLSYEIEEQTTKDVEKGVSDAFKSSVRLLIPKTPMIRF